MVCAGHCLGVAMAPAWQLPAVVPCVNAQRCHGPASLTLSPFQQFVSLPVAVGGKALGGSSNVWKIYGGSALSNGRTSLQRMIVNVTKEGGTALALVLEVEFIWKGEGTSVLLSGDFLNWESQLRLEKGPEGWFVVKQKLAPGTYKYKFIVDGQWQHSPDCPSVPDNAGGFNNEITVTDEKSTPQSPAKEAPAEAPRGEACVQATASEAPVAPKELAAKASPSPSAATSPPKPKAAAAGGGKKAAKAVAKSLPATMVEDVIPQLTAFFKKEEGISDVDLTFDDNQLEGSFVKNQVPYNFWAYFPDGKLEGSRGFSLTSHGSSPSTIEPFLIDEKKITSDLLVFWITKRLYAQKLLSTN